MLLLAPAFAAFPEDPTLSGMTDHEGVPVVDSSLLNEDYRSLVTELGTVVANKPILPASTTGSYGFELSLSTTFVFLGAKQRDRTITPWDRASPDEVSDGYSFIPTFSARKGLPLSTELGGSIGWIGMTRTGVASIYGRVALLEGYKPLPDLTLQVGYAGYVGNEELELGVLDLGVTLGGRLEIGAAPKLNTGRFEPFATFQLLRVSAQPTADTSTLEALAAQPFRGNSPEKPISVPTIGAGFQITSGNVHFKLAGSWSWLTLPTATAGMGFTF